MNDRTHCPETHYATEKNHEIFEPIPFVLFPGGGNAELPLSWSSAVAQQNAVENELATLRGSWRVVQLVENGQSVPPSRWLK